MTDRFGSVEIAPPIEIFAISKGYAEDTNENKVNLGVGGIILIFLRDFELIAD